LTAEDVLERDCSFFYRQEEDLPVGGQQLHQENFETEPQPLHGGGQSGGRGRRHRHRFRTLLRQQDDPFHPRHAFLYQDAVDVLSPSVLQEYKTRYKQLNQAEIYLDHHAACAEDPFDDDDDDDDVVVLDDDDNNNNNTTRRTVLSHSLQLDENYDTAVHTGTTTTRTTTASSSSIVRSDTAFHSSLCYMHHGRLLMRLPNDQVRLVMDPDLEAGILSVEQWRRLPSCSSSSSSSSTQQKSSLAILQSSSETTETSEQEEEEELPPLRYVLTVPMDLYQKLVKEMSHNMITTNSRNSSRSSSSSSLLSCCQCNTIHYKHGSERVDIRIAIWILGTVLIVLFINTVIWGAGK
jgi:hypothetical protein